MSVLDPIASHLRTPLYRNAYALILSTGLTSALGFVYWLLAAHTYPPDVVGINSAALSSMMFLAGLAQFSLANVLVRFMPQAGDAALALAERASLLTFVAGILAGLIFVLGLDHWAPSLASLRVSPLMMAFFAISTGTWGLFALQEGVLTGLRQATWGPVRNSGFAVGKIALLLVFAGFLPAYGILASWIIPAGLAILPVGILIRRHLVTALGPTRPAPSKLVRSQIVQYAVADYPGSLCWLAATMLVPVLVTEVAGPTANAHFYLAWTIAYTLYLIAPSMGSSFIVESAIDPAKLSTYPARVFLQTARLVIPMVAVLVIAAPYVLGLLGGAYAAEGTLLLRLLALSALPNIVSSLYTSIARARRQLAVVVGILAAQCISVLVLSYFLLHLAGIAGVGFAWLISQSTIALVLLAARRQIFREARPCSE